MASPNSLLRGARAFARDFPRDNMPQGYLWDVIDYVPLVVDANLTGRGGWQWGSSVMGGDAIAGILGSFTAGDKLMVVGADAQWYEVDQNSPYNATPRGAANIPKQHPVQVTNAIVNFDAAGANVPKVGSTPSGTFVANSMDASAPRLPLGCSYKQYVVGGGATLGVNGVATTPNIVYFSYPGDPTRAWDANSNIPTAKAITAMGALRAAIIVFHAGSVERIRGSTPPYTGAGTSGYDMFAEGLFDRVGCTQPLTIAYWNDNCVFADEHGVHVTDGAVIRNLVNQGGILYYWRMLWGGMTSVAGCTFLDYYLITVGRSDGSWTTLICDLNKRQWFRFANLYVRSYIASSGGSGMERVWASMSGTKRLARIGPCFFPYTQGVTPTFATDDDGKAVLPVLETPYYRMGREGRKRSRFAYLSYDARTATPIGQAKGELLDDEIEAPPLAPPELLATVTPVLEVGFVTNPMDPSYTIQGSLPPTSNYSRFKLPVNRAPYGVAFRVRQTQPTIITRIYDLAVEGGQLEPSRE